MPFQLHHDAELGILRGRLEGELTPADVETILEQITHSGAYPPDIDVLWDARDMDFQALEPAAVRKFVDMRKHNPARGLARAAFLVPDDLGYGMTRMYQMLAEQASGAIGVFRSAEEALQWLRPEH